MSKPSKAKVTAKAEELGIDVDPEWTVKEIQKAIASADSDTEVKTTSEEVEESSPGDDSTVEPTAVSAIEVTPVSVFPASGASRLPRMVRLPHRGITQVKHFKN